MTLMKTSYLKIYACAKNKGLYSLKCCFIYTLRNQRSLMIDQSLTRSWHHEHVFKLGGR